MKTDRGMVQLTRTQGEGRWGGAGGVKACEIKPSRASSVGRYWLTYFTDLAGANLTVITENDSLRRLKELMHYYYLKARKCPL